VYEPYDPSHPAVFLETLNRTYELTRDCPEVSGVRTIEEVIQGHQTQGSLARDRWWLVRIGSVSQVGCWSALAAGTPIGVMLTSQEKRGETWEVGYMGLIPEARKLGFGSEMLHKVLAEARADAAPRVTLSVDDRNVPAWRLYRRLGFEPYDQRTVFLTIWRRAS
jgi:ribosomal protein S18 acetylase RimI-like enzyme